MILHHPQVLWALFGLIPLIVIFAYQYLEGRRSLAAAGLDVRERYVENVYFLKWLGQLLFAIIFYAAMVFSLAEVHWGDEPVEEDRSNLDLVFLVDVSRSMNAEDFGQSRLDAAREFILGLVQEFPKARYSMSAFKGDAITLVPMTENPLAVEYLLQYLAPSVITSPGTDLERALLRALSSIPEGSDRNRLIVLLSDGEALSGNLEATAARLNRLGVPVLSLGFGSVEGAGIPVDGERLLLHPQSGEVVVTRLDRSRLARAAELSGGAYFDASEPGGFTAASGWIQTHLDARESEGFRLSLIPRYGFFSSIALVCLVLSLALRTVRIRGII